MRFDDGWGEPVYRLCESDGEICVRWLPDEWPDPDGLDKGGFDSRHDAQSFKLGIDRLRAEHGLIAESVDDIDRERAKLDHFHARPLPEAPEVTYRRAV